MSARIPRLALDQLAPALAEKLRPRVARLGYLGEFFACAGHQPAALAGFVDFTEALKQALPERITQLCALSVAGELDNDYERNQHERLARRLGLSRDWIAAVNARDPMHAPELDDTDRAVQRLALASVRRGGRGVAGELGDVVARIGAEQTVGVLLVISRYAAHALFVNALEIRPPVPSIFEDGFEP
ncbi:MAG: carboxymuconolactone decarboxylase family protein [Solirubrobacteraceae bacterium]